MFPQGPSVRYRKQCDAHLAAVLVHGALDVDADGRRTLVQDRELWFVVEQASHLEENENIFNLDGRSSNGCGAE